MNNRERVRAILNYENYDRMPVVHFGYWKQTLETWAAEGHLKPEEIEGYADSNRVDMHLNLKLGGISTGRITSPQASLFPASKRGLRSVPNHAEGCNPEGVVVLTDRHPCGSITRSAD